MHPAPLPLLLCACAAAARVPRPGLEPQPEGRFANATNTTPRRPLAFPLTPGVLRLSSISSPIHSSASSSSSSGALGTGQDTAPAAPPPNVSLSVTAGASSSTPSCTPIVPGSPVISYLIVYTSTVTWTDKGTASMPFESISTPTYCALTPAPVALTLGFPNATQTPPLASERPVVATTQATITFVTTAKSPSVAFPSQPPPDYSQTWIGGGGGGSGELPGQHQPPNQGTCGVVVLRGHLLSAFLCCADLSRSGPADSTWAVTFGSGDVTINHHTWSNLQPDETTTVTVGRGTFTIEPTGITGEGATIHKPRPRGTAFVAPSPITTVLDGHHVAVDGSQVAVDGTSFTLDPSGVAATVAGDVVSIRPGSIVIGGQTMTFSVQSPEQTNVVVAGGEMLTAIGPTLAVLQSTTLTYGPGIPMSSSIIDNDTLTLQPSGIVVDSSTLGGPRAAATATTYHVVGGASVTEVGLSLAVINGTTFTVGPRAHTTTTVFFSREAFTIGPLGVEVSGATFTYPFESCSVTTIQPSGTSTDVLPAVTAPPDHGSNDKDSDDSPAAPLPLPSHWASLCVSIAFGVFVWML